MQSVLNSFILTPKRWIQSINALLIQQNFTSEERILQLNQVAISQMKSLLKAKGIKFLEKQ